jgi:hypothetical protein
MAKQQMKYLIGIAFESARSLRSRRPLAKRYADAKEQKECEKDHRHPKPDGRRNIAAAKQTKQVTLKTFATRIENGITNSGTARAHKQAANRKAPSEPSTKAPEVTIRN